MTILDHVMPKSNIVYQAKQHLIFRHGRHGSAAFLPEVRAVVLEIDVIF